MRLYWSQFRALNIINSLTLVKVFAPIWIPEPGLKWENIISSNDNDKEEPGDSLCDWCPPFRFRILHQNSVVRPRNIADNRAFSVTEATETIIWKSPIVSVVPIVLEFLETTGTIRTIIWRPGLKETSYFGLCY